MMPHGFRPTIPGVTPPPQDPFAHGMNLIAVFATPFPRDSYSAEGASLAADWKSTLRQRLGCGDGDVEVSVVSNRKAKVSIKSEALKHEFARVKEEVGRLPNVAMVELQLPMRTL